MNRFCWDHLFQIACLRNVVLVCYYSKVKNHVFSETADSANLPRKFLLSDALSHTKKDTDEYVKIINHQGTLLI